MILESTGNMSTQYCDPQPLKMEPVKDVFWGSEHTR